MNTMRLDILSFLTVSVYYQAIARVEITLENPFFIHAPSSAELRRRAEISRRASSGDLVVAPDAPAAAVSNTHSEFSSQSQSTDPSGQYETHLSAAGSTDSISLTDTDSGCFPSAGHKFRKRQGCVGKSEDNSAHGDDDLDLAVSPTEPESGCSPSGRKIRKRQYCGRSSGSDEPRDDSSSDNEKRLCPRNRKTLCCQGPKPSGIYTYGCSDCKYHFLVSASSPFPGAPPPQASTSPIPPFRDK